MSEKTERSYRIVLLAEDDLETRVNLSLALQKEGFSVIECKDGMDLLKRVSPLLKGDDDPEYDLIISDIEMPHLDGFALCNKLKGNPNTISIPVILVSSNDTEQYIDKGFRVGADSYIVKTDLKAKLLDTTLEVLEKSKFHNNNHILVVDDSATIRSVLYLAKAPE